VRILRLFKREKEVSEIPVQKRSCEHEWETDIVDSRKCAVCGETVSVQKWRRCKLCGKEETWWESINAYVLEPITSDKALYICARCLRYYTEVEHELEKLLCVVPTYDFSTIVDLTSCTVLIFKNIKGLRKWLKRYIAYRSKLVKGSIMGIRGYMFDAIPKDPMARPYVILIHKEAIAEEARNRWLARGG